MYHTDVDLRLRHVRKLVTVIYSALNSAYMQSSMRHQRKNHKTSLGTLEPLKRLVLYVVRVKVNHIIVFQ